MTCPPAPMLPQCSLALAGPVLGQGGSLDETSLLISGGQRVIAGGTNCIGDLASRRKGRILRERPNYHQESLTMASESNSQRSPCEGIVHFTKHWEHSENVLSFAQF